MISRLRGYVKSVIDFSETGVREQKVVIDLILEQLESSLFREQSADITMNFIPRFCGGIHASRCFVGDVPAEDSFDITSPFVRSQLVRNERCSNLTSLHSHRLSRVCHLAVHLVQTCLVPLPNRPNSSPRSRGTSSFDRMSPQHLGFAHIKTQSAQQFSPPFTREPRSVQTLQPLSILPESAALLSTSSFEARGLIFNRKLGFTCTRLAGLPG